MPEYKRVGADENGLFPPRVMTALDERYSSYSPSTETTSVFTTGSLANQAQQSGVLTVTPSFIATKITTDRPARVRLYPTSAQMMADANREPGTDPDSDVDHGVMLDVVTIPGELDWELTPKPVIFGRGTPVEDIFITIDNLSGVTAVVAVTLTYKEI